jgi:hypothetical protein
MEGRVYIPDKEYVLMKNNVPYATCSTLKTAKFFASVDGSTYHLVPHYKNEDVQKWFEEEKKPNTDSLTRGPYARGAGGAYYRVYDYQNPLPWL